MHVACPNCDGTGYVVEGVGGKGTSEATAFMRFPCPVCAGTGKRSDVLPEKDGLQHE